MPVTSEIYRTRELIPLIIPEGGVNWFSSSSQIPDWTPPKGVVPGSPEHMVFFTLSFSLYRNCNDSVIFDLSREAYEDEKTRQIFSLESLQSEPVSIIMDDLNQAGLCVKRRRDAENWRSIGISLLQKWGADPVNFIRSCDGNVPLILERMRSDPYSELIDFPQIIGDKRAPKWLHMIRDSGGYDGFFGFEKIPMMADIHITRASIALGVVHGRYSGQLSPITQKVLDTWYEAEAATPKSSSVGLYEVSEFLHQLSKNGCILRDGKRTQCPRSSECLLKDYCVPGMYAIENKGILMDTHTDTGE